MYVPLLALLDLHQHASKPGNCLSDPTVLHVALYLSEYKITTFTTFNFQENTYIYISQVFTSVLTRLIFWN
jgi:hypothetical protein